MLNKQSHNLIISIIQLNNFFFVQSCINIANEGKNMELPSQIWINLEGSLRAQQLAGKKEQRQKEKTRKKRLNVLLCKWWKFDAVPQHISTIQSNFLAIIAARKKNYQSNATLYYQFTNNTALNGKHTALNGKHITLQQKIYPK